jgi:hypothetical protein
MSPDPSLTAVMKFVLGPSCQSDKNRIEKISLCDLRVLLAPFAV